MLIPRRSAVLFAALALTSASLSAQMSDSMSAQPMSSPANSSTETKSADSPKPVTESPASHSAAQKILDKTKTAHAADNTPLTPSERAQQMLNRFTFGPRPGEVQAVTAIGAQAWFEKQLQPSTIGDGALEKRIATDYPALALTPQQFLAEFPSRRIIPDVAKGKTPYPTDPIELGLYQTLVAKYNAYQTPKDANGKDLPVTPPTDEELAKRAADGKAAASRVAGALFALPKAGRMVALMQMPVEDRIAFTSYVDGDQKKLLLADFTPREREIFQGMNSNFNASGILPYELQQARVVRAILSERQLQEVMTDFWFNHFNIYIHKDADEWYTASYERDTIRPHALGKFRDLLLATAQSPAMMVYLDNFTSTGPNSIANGGNNPNGKRGSKGLNENYAREVMELHTISVNGGYTQADVTQLARVLTGWTVDNNSYGGDFLFNPKTHEPGTKQWLGETVQEDGMNEGLHALTKLANSPQCAHFISFLIAQRFVADEPPVALVARMQKSYLASDGDIKTVLRTMVQSPEFNSHRYFRNKVKTPMEYVASTFRSTGTDPSNPGTLVYNLRTMGMPLYEALPPTGYYITADQWMNSVALIDRLNFAVNLGRGGGIGGMKFDGPRLFTAELMAQPQLPAQASRAKVVNASSTTTSAPAQDSGTDMIVGVMENGLLGNGGVSEHTNAFMHQQAATQNGTAAEKVNQITALVVGSPEFQLR